MLKQKKCSADGYFSFKEGERRMHFF